MHTLVFKIYFFIARENISPLFNPPEFTEHQSQDHSDCCRNIKLSHLYVPFILSYLIHLISFIFILLYFALFSLYFIIQLISPQLKTDLHLSNLILKEFHCRSWEICTWQFQLIIHWTRQNLSSEFDLFFNLSSRIS